MNENTFTVTQEELNATVAEAFKAAMKDADFGKAEVKHGIIPVELSEAEKSLSPEKQNRIKANKFLRAVYQNDLQYLKSVNAIEKAINIEGNATRGGNLVNPEFRAEVIRFMEEYGVIRRNATVIKMNSQKLLIPTASDKITGAFTSEGSAKTESNPTFNQTELVRNEYAALMVVSKQLLEDSEVDLLPLCASYVAEDFARTEDVQGFLGTGTPITGIANTSGIEVIRTTGTDFGSLVGDDLIDMTVAMSPSRMMGAKFYLHRTAFGKIRKLVDKNDNYLYQELGEPMKGLIAGYPFELVEAVNSYANAASADTPYIFFGNLGNVILGDRMSISTDITYDATIGSNNLFEKNLVGFRFEQSFDIVLPIGSAFTVLKTAE